MIRRLCLALLLLLLLPAPASAWWEYGHGTVARIAYMNVSPATRARIDRLLAQGRLLDTPTCSVRTIELASYWPDCIKTLGERFSYASPWHYQNVDICRPFDQAAPCRDGNCVSAQIERSFLANTALYEILEVCREELRLARAPRPETVVLGSSARKLRDQLGIDLTAHDPSQADP